VAKFYAIHGLALYGLLLGCQPGTPPEPPPDPRPPATPPAAGAKDAGAAGASTGAGGQGGAGGSDAAVVSADVSPAPDAGQAEDVAVAMDTGAAGQADAGTAAVPGDGAVSGGQGPVAGGRIVFSQDFEMGMDGITRSPTNLPADRAEIADDPLGQRGKVMKIVYRAGDNFMTGGGSTHTRSWISNTGYSFPAGSTVHLAWGYLTTSRQIDAAMAQVIRPGGPMWLIEGNGDGTTYVNCRSCGGKANLPVTMEPNRWYDFRVEMVYSNGGAIKFFVDGKLVLERRMSAGDGSGTRAHWDGGLYNHAAGTYTRTVYISNLSVGLE